MLTEVQIDIIKRDYGNVRQTSDALDEAELVASIRAHGVLQPILCLKDAHGIHLVAGARRLDAATTAGLESIPANVITESEAGVVALQVIENVHRSDLNPMEEAEAFGRLRSSGDMPVEEIAAMIGKSPAYVSQRLTLLEAGNVLKDAVAGHQISFAVARQLAQIGDEDAQASATESAVQYGATEDTAKLWRAAAEEDRILGPDTPGAGEAGPVWEGTQEQPQTEAGRTLYAGTICSICQQQVPFDQTVLQRVCHGCLEAIEQAAETAEGGDSE